MNFSINRRGFMRVGTVGALAVIAGGLGMGIHNSLLAQKTISGKIGIALVGLGYYGEILADALQETNLGSFSYNL